MLGPLTADGGTHDPRATHERRDTRLLEHVPETALYMRAPERLLQ